MTIVHNILYLFQQKEKYRTGEFGTTDGSFQGNRYFVCAKDCGLFVSLQFLSPVDRKSDKAPTEAMSEKKYSSAVRSNENSHQSQISRLALKKSSVDEPHRFDHPLRFEHGQRVVFYDKHGGKHYGTVRWTGNKSATRVFDYMVVGIQTVSKSMLCVENASNGCQFCVCRG